ncbi:MAG: hypothetical protein H6573_13685 [Lewinellaceae bacterium]|nr:hypothetical protein [Phaeodactylibacter sp.]MCB9348537.1 hypothetical protein [Lewinellaceae bacterium]
MNKTLPTFAGALFAALLFFTIPLNVQAQRPGGVGIGVQLGDPSGLSLNLPTGGRASVDLLAAWDLDNFFFLNGHALFMQPLNSAPNFGVFYGPGLFIGFRDRNEKRWDFDNQAYAGASGTIGLNYFIGQFEIYLRATIRLQLIDKTDGSAGGGLGLRYYF